MAEDAKHPPDARRGKQAFGVVDDDMVVIADAECANCGGEGIRCRQHVRQRASGVGCRIDVEIAGAGNMRRCVFGFAVAAGRRQVPGTVEISDRWIFEPRGQPFGADKGFGIRVFRHDEAVII